MSDDKPSLWRSRLKLIAVIACFAVPYGGATLYFQNVKQGGIFASKANGVLLEPAVPLGEFDQGALGDKAPVDETGLQRHWTLVYFNDGACDAACEERLYFSRQVRVMLGREMYRVRRLLVSDTEPAEALQEEHVQLLYAGADADGDGLRTRVSNAVGEEVFSTPGQFYLVDPFGNLMMRFPADIPAKSMLKDIKVLLKASRIG